jgi:broad specificity phosphatase PhoE
VLVRHGESMAMVDSVVGGHEGCRGLSDLGRRQVEALRDRLAATGELRADALYASVLPRAIETAEILAPALGGLDVRQDCDLCEQHPGEGDGLTWAEFEER